MDQPAIVPYDPIDHFDSEELTRAFRRLGANRGLLMIELQKQSPNQAEVWKFFGQMLHQIQDFYSHSSWVAAGYTDIVHFGTLTKNYSAAMAPPPPFNQGAISYPDSPIPGTYCDESATTLVTPVPSQITTGYYKPRTPPPGGHCAHGSWPHLFANCVLLVLLPDGINHDSSCFSSSADVAIFHLAKSLATEETTEFAQAIITDLSNANNTNGICVLLGLDPGSDPCAMSIISATFTYQGTMPGAGGVPKFGVGQFVYNATLNNVTAFTLTTAVEDNSNPGTFGYGLAGVSSLSYNSTTGALNLFTQPVSGTNPIYYPELFSVSSASGSNIGNTATADFASIPLESGPVVVTVIDSQATVLSVAPLITTTYPGGTITLVTSATNGDLISIPTPANLLWTSSDPSLATVSGGVVTGVTTSQTPVTMTVQDPVSKASASTIIYVVTGFLGNWTGSVSSSCGNIGGPSTMAIAGRADGTALSYSIIGADGSQTFGDSFTYSGNTGTGYGGETLQLSGNSVGWQWSVECWSGTFTRVL
jgi:hypothetical protein